MEETGWRSGAEEKKGRRVSGKVVSQENMELVLVLAKYIRNIIISQGFGVLFGYCCGHYPIILGRISLVNKGVYGL